MRHVVLQLATGEPYESMMDLTKEHHLDYCDTFGWDFSPRKQFVSHDPFIDRSMSEMMMIRALTDEYQDGDVICSLSADSIIMPRRGVDLRDALPHGCDIAIFGNKTFCNSGFSIVRNSQQVRDVFAKVVEKGPINGNADISPRISEELRESDLYVQYLGSKWQWFKYGSLEIDCPEEEAVIRAWHGGSRYNAYREMKLLMVGIKEGVI